MRIFSRVATIVLAATLATSLSGCFMIPLADGRSPFDDPFGVSKSQIREAIPMLQAALDEVDTGSNWELQASGTSDNCEGSCNLRLLASFKPSESLFAEEIARSITEEELKNGDAIFPPSAPLPGQSTYIDVVVPNDVWRAVSLAAIEASEKLGINVTVEGGYAARITQSDIEYFASVNECPAVEASLGTFDQNGSIIDKAERFTVRSSGDLTSCSVEFHTKKSSRLGDELGL